MAMSGILGPGDTLSPGRAQCLERAQGEICMTEPSSTPSTSTFVIRFWREWSATVERWRGRIEHVQSGQHADFLDLAGVSEFIQSLGVMPDRPASPRRADE